jgi:hypothetical protein
MTLDPKNREGLNAPDAKFLEIVDKYGWHVMTVAPRVGEEVNSFAYSTGLFLRFQQPEIILFGLDHKNSVGIINEIGQQMKSGKTFEIGKVYADIFAPPVKCQFQRVPVTVYPEYFGWSLWFYEGSDFPVWQCFWPDKNGIFPWEDSCDPEIVKIQPRLFLPPAPIA